MMDIYPRKYSHDKRLKIIYVIKKSKITDNSRQALISFEYTQEELENWLRLNCDIATQKMKKIATGEILSFGENEEKVNIELLSNIESQKRLSFEELYRIICPPSDVAITKNGSSCVAMSQSERGENQTPSAPEKAELAPVANCPEFQPISSSEKIFSESGVTSVSPAPMEEKITDFISGEMACQKSPKISDNQEKEPKSLALANQNEPILAKEPENKPSQKTEMTEFPMEKNGFVKYTIR